jgi:hypothetical protein
MADFARALTMSAKPQINNNDNIGNATNVWPVANLPENQIRREQRAFEEYERIQAELRPVKSKIIQCEKLMRNAPNEIKKNQELIDYLVSKNKHTNRDQVDLRRAIAENVRIRNDLAGCRIEMAGLLEKKKHLNAAEFFQKKWLNEASSMAAFNKPVSATKTQRRSMVGGRRRRRYTRRTRK